MRGPWIIGDSSSQLLSGLHILDILTLLEQLYEMQSGYLENEKEKSEKKKNIAKKIENKLKLLGIKHLEM